MPRYHFTGATTGEKFPDNANDANALFFYKGWYHAMYQSVQHRGKGFWTADFAHVVSQDLARWERLPDALTRVTAGASTRPWNDDAGGGNYDGAFSLLPPPHGPVILYEPRHDCEPPQKCVSPNGITRSWPLVLVKAADSADPKLIKWDQAHSQVVTLNASMVDPLYGWCNTSTSADTLACVPSSIWQSSDHFNMVAGGSRWFAPVTSDLTHWSQDRRPFVGPGAWDNRRPASQYSGARCGDGGTQSFVSLPRPVDGAALPAGAPTHMLRCGGAGHFVLGTYHPDNESFVPAGITASLNAGNVGWEVTAYANDRLMMFGWLAATCGGCRPQVSPQRLSILRELRYEPRTRPPVIVSAPLPELALLHAAGAPLFVSPAGGLTLPAGGAPTAGKATTLVNTSTLAARAMDLQMNLSLLGSSAVHCGAVVLADLGGDFGQAAVLELNVSERFANGTRSGTLRLWTASYPANSTANTLPVVEYAMGFEVLPHETVVDLRAIVDHSSVEAFAMGGRAVVTLAVVPRCTETEFAKDKCAAGQAQAGVATWSETGAVVTSAVAHEMGCGWASG
jgi:hypothetical protein